MFPRSSKYLIGLVCLAALFTSCTSLKYAGVNRLRHYAVYSPQVPEAFDGYRIAFASDFHLESKFKERQLHGTVEAVRSLHPDVLLLGGDYQEGCQYVEPLFRELAKTNPTDGIFAVLGNNDYERCTDTLRTVMDRYGIRLLEHAVDTLWRAGQHMVVCGVRNPFNVRDNSVCPTLDQRPEEFVVLLTHTPDYVEDTDITNTDLALAGHTHGGQVTFFRLIAPATGSKYGRRFLSGKKQNSAGIPIIITNGLGTSRRNIRFCAPTEVVEVVLHRKK